MLQQKAKIIFNKCAGDNFLHMSLDCPKIAKAALSGQFLNIKVNDSDVPLLRRPLSIHRVKGQRIEILYEVVGPATKILAQRKSGEYLNIIGPLGNGFDYKSQMKNGKSLILVAGGMGVAPLVFLAEKLREIPNPKSKIPILVLIGARTKNEIICEQEFKKLGCEVKIATDDGSQGFHGRVTELLKSLLLTNATIYACGPRPMLKVITQISQKFDIPAQISLEEHMACGIGACLGCVINTKEGYKRVCKDGPVLDAQEIIWPKGG